MAKIGKKELQNLTNRYEYYLKHENDFPEVLDGMKIVLHELNLTDQVELEVFKRNASITVQSILENLISIFKKYKKEFRIKLLQDYLFDVEFLGFSEDDARATKSSIEYINNYK